MFDIIWKGIIIGICVSAPMGPIGVLCIQRTLNRGKYYGIATGLGATASDLLYAIVTGYGMSFVVDFLQLHQFVFQIAGSILVFAFGFYLSRSNPVRQLSKTSEAKESYMQDFVTSFALTITNPLIIFLFMALYARFSFITSATQLGEAVVGFSSILVGACGWWFFLTSIVNVFRNKFNVRGLRLVNITTGCIIMLLAIIGIIMTISGDEFIR
ncbi:MAG: lysine transporter LysE [Bacteroidetes bacterium]|jgi:threonine/homoserine/homoserine lactone efflux protein|nr:lysine transporter LysE [Bacteroidota bacterium]